MQNGDISNLATPRMWVVEDVVLTREDVLVQARKHWWSRRRVSEASEAVVVQPAPMSLLWRFAQRWETSGMRLELLHVGQEQEGVMDLLDKFSANPFADVLTFPTFEAIADHLAYRPDVMFVVDVPDRALRWGSRGLNVMEVRA